MVACAETLAAERKVKCHFARAGGNNITNGITDACWFGWQTMEERNSSNTATCQYVWGTYVDECIQINLLQPAGPQQLAIGVYYPLQDTLYRTMALANSSGTPVEAYDTDAYGNTIIFTGPGSDKTWFTDDDAQATYGANSIIYCGYRYDAEMENYYVRNRYYSPTLGRRLTRDPIGYQGGINLYGYVDSSPVGLLDSSGSQVFSPGLPQAAPPINPAGAEAAEALLAALAAEIGWSWIPDVAFAAAVTAAAVVAWEVTCRALYAAYKAACDGRAEYPCRTRMFCDEYPPAIAVRVACATGRATYLNAGCDVIIPTKKNHLGEMLNAWQAVANCEAASKSCIPRPACPTVG